MPVVGYPAQKLNYGQATVGAVATAVGSNNSARRTIRITNTSATVAVFVGDSAVTTATGHSLAAGGTILFEFYVGIVWCITAATAVVTFLEESD